MELWWFIEPLLLTGLVCAVFTVVLGFLFRDSDSIAVIVIMLVLLFPLALAVLAVGAWLICGVFCWIWSPYI